ncbi:MAG: UPF0254 family protein [Methanobacteriaceae archaeon]|jgi:uncharacterized protein (UPF0254 family)|nr:UPF0254 family protein [Methanobacteriaceae archaeon]
MLKVATAECFTHGLIAREIHAFSQGYEGEFGCCYLSPDHESNLTSEDKLKPDISVVCGIFVPTLSGLKNNLKINAPQPYKVIKGVKVYEENYDKQVAVLMANAVREISKADIGIGTTAGVGRGGIAISTNEFTIVTTSGYYANLTAPCSSQLLKRQEQGVKKALDLFFAVLNDDMGKIMDYDDISLKMNSN